MKQNNLLNNGETSHTAGADKLKGESMSPNTKKFKDVESLCKAYGFLQAEFTKRCQQNKKLVTRMNKLLYFIIFTRAFATVSLAVLLLQFSKFLLNLQVNATTVLISATVFCICFFQEKFLEVIKQGIQVAKKEEKEYDFKNKK